ncbi:hypothetical protein TcasGA2_TC010862 [Tribolium castaneum]|uniref:Uncharacterized protein n=1 Tax=Tribolium castaneum TaxID=7070 RepID=D6W7P2_TRICA|nr:hypothetical protein TcasGA2_TC010862 [Tribolium castaneum]
MDERVDCTARRPATFRYAHEAHPVGKRFNNTFKNKRAPRYQPGIKGYLSFMMFHRSTATPLAFLIKVSMIVYCERMRVVHVQPSKVCAKVCAERSSPAKRPVARSTNTGHILKGHRVPLLEGPRPPPSRASSLWERRFTTPPNTETNATRSEITGLGHMENKVISRGYGFIIPVENGTVADDLQRSQRLHTEQSDKSRLECLFTDKRVLNKHTLRRPPTAQLRQYQPQTSRHDRNAFPATATTSHPSLSTLFPLSRNYFYIFNYYLILQSTLLAKLTILIQLNTAKLSGSKLLTCEMIAAQIGPNWIHSRSGTKRRLTYQNSEITENTEKFKHGQQEKLKRAVVEIVTSLYVRCSGKADFIQSKNKTLNWHCKFSWF